MSPYPNQPLSQGRILSLKMLVPSLDFFFCFIVFLVGWSVLQRKRNYSAESKNAARFSGNDLDPLSYLLVLARFASLYFYFSQQPPFVSCVEEKFCFDAAFKSFFFRSCHFCNCCSTFQALKWFILKNQL